MNGLKSISDALKHSSTFFTFTEPKEIVVLSFWSRLPKWPLHRGLGFFCLFVFLLFFSATDLPAGCQSADFFCMPVFRVPACRLGKFSACHFADELVLAKLLLTKNCKDIIIIITYPLTARVIRAPQMTSKPVSSIFPCSPLPSGTWRVSVWSDCLLDLDKDFLVGNMIFV